MRGYFVLLRGDEFVGCVRAESYRQAIAGMGAGIEAEALSSYAYAKRHADRYRRYRSAIDSGPATSSSIIDIPDPFNRTFPPA